MGLNDLADLLEPVLEKLPKPETSNAIPKPKRARKLLESSATPMILRDDCGGEATPQPIVPQKRTHAAANRKQQMTSSSPFVNNRTQTEYNKYSMSFKFEEK